MAHKKTKNYEWEKINGLYILAASKKDGLKTTLSVYHDPSSKHVLTPITEEERGRLQCSDCNPPLRQIRYDTLFTLGRLVEREKAPYIEHDKRNHMMIGKGASGLVFFPQIEAFLLDGQYVFGAEHHQVSVVPISLLESMLSFSGDLTPPRFHMRMMDIFDISNINNYGKFTKYIENSNLPDTYVKGLMGITKH